MRRYWQEVEYDLPTDFSVFGHMPVVQVATTQRELTQQVKVEPAVAEPSDHILNSDFISFDDNLPLQDAAAAATAAAHSTTITPLPKPKRELPAVGASAASPAPAVLATPATPTEAAQLPPWLSEAGWARISGVRSPLLRLHQEITDFMRYVQPSDAEAARREAAVERVREAVLSIWPCASLAVFGSYACGLYLPTSDIDAVLLHSGCRDPRQGLKALANALHRRDMATNLQVIAKAKVPIVKFVERESGFQFDVSFDVANGPAAAEWVVKQMDSLVALKPIALVLKVFLQQRELNEVYTGGIGSYALLTMIIGHLFMHPSRFTNKSQRLDDNLGVLLLDFLDLYGRRLNHEEVGVSVQHGGGFFTKESREGFHNPARPFLFCIEDPNDKTNDISRNSYNSRQVRVAFDYAYQSLVRAEEPGDEDGSLLQRLVRLDEALCDRPCPTPPLLLECPEGTPATPAAASGRGERGERRKRGEKRERDSAEDSSGDTPGSAHDGAGGGGRSHKRSRLGGGGSGGGSGGGEKQARWTSPAVRDRHGVPLIDPKRSPVAGTPMQVNVGSHGQRHVKFH